MRHRFGRLDNPCTTPDFDALYSFACCGIISSQFTASEAFDFSGSPGYWPATVRPAAVADEQVMPKAGARPRDFVSRWTVDDIADRAGGWSNRRPADWMEGLAPGTAPVDADRDGMADDFFGIFRDSFEAG